MTNKPSLPVEERCRVCGHVEASHGIGHGAVCVECANAPVNGVALHPYRPSPPAQAARAECPECAPHRAHLPHVCQRDYCDCSSAEPSPPAQVPTVEEARRRVGDSIKLPTRRDGGTDLMWEGRDAELDTLIEAIRADERAAAEAAVDKVAIWKEVTAEQLREDAELIEGTMRGLADFAAGRYTAIERHDKTPEEWVQWLIERAEAAEATIAELRAALVEAAEEVVASWDIFHRVTEGDVDHLRAALHKVAALAPKPGD